MTVYGHLSACVSSECSPEMRLHIWLLMPLKSSVMAELWTQLMFSFSYKEREEGDRGGEREGERERKGGGGER